MVLSGDTLWIAGPPDLPDFNDAAASLAGRKGGLLSAVSASDGRQLIGLQLDSPPVFDGMAVANEKLYVALRDGQVICLQ